MSGLHFAFDLGDLDFDEYSFRDTVFAQLRDKAGKMSSSTSTATPLKYGFDLRVAEVKSPKSDINSLILDYLTMEGYPKAAANFSKEANLQPQQEDESMQTRQKIQNSIHTGNIESAVAALNELDPEILDKDPQLHFSLLRLQLIELIRVSQHGGSIAPAVQFATKNLAPRAAQNNEFLQDLEKAMALLLFPHDNLRPELAALLHSDLRRQTAAQVNEAVLVRQTERRESAIRHLVKMRVWAETSARTRKGHQLPDSIEIGLAAEEGGEDEDEDEKDEDEDEDENYGARGTGHDPMITS